MEEIEIPNDIDEKLFIMWEKEEAMAAFLGFFLGGQIFGLLFALIGAYVGYKAMVVFKARQPRGVIWHWMYWHGLITFRKCRWGNGLYREVSGK